MLNKSTFRPEITPIVSFPLRLRLCTRVCAISHGLDTRIPSPRQLPRPASKKVSEKNSPYADVEDIAMIARELLKCECPPSEADAFADIVLERDDVQEAPLLMSVDIYILMMKYGSHSSAAKAVNGIFLLLYYGFRARGCIMYRERSDYISMSQAATLCMLCCKRIVELMKDFQSIEKDLIIDICWLRDYAFSSFKCRIEEQFSKPLQTEEELATLVDALKIFKTGNYHNFSEKQIRARLTAFKNKFGSSLPPYSRNQLSELSKKILDGDIGRSLRQEPRFPSDTKYIADYSSFYEGISLSIAVQINKMPLDAQQNMLYVVKVLKKEVGIDIHLQEEDIAGSGISSTIPRRKEAKEKGADNL